MEQPVPVPAAAGGLWQDVRAALAGEERDYTTGNVSRAVVVLSIPMVLEMAMESVFAVVDVFFVARLSPNAVATVGLTESVLTLVFALCMGLSAATTAMVARRIGEHDPEAAAVAAVQSILVGLGLALPIGVAGVALAPRLLSWLGGSPALVAEGWGYTAWILGGSGTVILLFLINAVFRGAGDPALAMRALWLGNLCNIVLDPCLIFGLGPFPELGLTGAAVATTIGRGIGVVYQTTALWRGRGRISVRGTPLRLEPAVALRLLRVAVPGMFQWLIATASWLGLVRILAVFGSAALAGYTIAIRVIVFAILPSWGMSNAAATLVGQNLGARQPERAERSAWLTGWYNMLFLGAVAVVFVLGAEAIIGLFTSDPEVVRHGVSCLRLVSYGYPFYAYGMVIVQAFNGAGDTVTPTAINLFCYWLFQIPLAWVLARSAGLGPDGVFLAITIAESVVAVVAVLAFRRGTWKTREI
jgi:putative MATE family efflux protein